jgi:hypothetical protein
MIYSLNEDYLFVSLPIALKVFKWGECVRHSESWDRGRPYFTMNKILSVSKVVEPLHLVSYLLNFRSLLAS